MEKFQKDYQKLHLISKHAEILNGISSHLDWDQETYMPTGAAGIRAEQLKTMAGLIHREKTSKKFARALGKFVDIPTGKILENGLSPAQKAAIKEWRRDYIKDTALPAKFVEDFAKLTSESILAWRSAKQESDFKRFAPYLEKIVKFSRKKADYLGYKDHPYDALLDCYEPEMTTAEIAPMFTLLRNALVPMIKMISTQSIDDKMLFGEWDKVKQMEFSNKILNTIGYDMNKGRVDFSSHPFSSSSHPTDSRITTRIHPTSLMSNIFVILHEAGHALYAMGLSEDLYGTPLGNARSMGVHESQSRWWETLIGLSKPFWQYFLPLLKDTFKGKLDHITLDDFYRAINKVEPSFIRVEADEMTYPLHVILRFELEKGLIEGSLKASDVPELWNAKMEQFLGIIPSNNREGCLQDIHWAMGGFGYFPTYILGNVYAAQLFAAFAKEHPDWEKRVAAGDFSSITAWLHDKIHQHGRRFTTHELMQQATGQAITPEPYLEYLRNKYGKIYKL